MASSTALLLLLLAALAATTAQLHEREAFVDPAWSNTTAEQYLPAVKATTADQLHEPLAEHVEPAVDISAEQYLAAVKATIAELDKMAPHVDEPEPEPEPEPDDGRRTYIIELEPPGGGRQDAVLDADAARSWHATFLPSATTSSQGNPTLLYSYRKVITGFAARLTEEELKEVSAKPGFLRSQEETILTLHTTHTPAFLRLPNRMGEAPDNWPGNGGRGVVIGVFDSGIDDTHPSLGDAGMQPPPSWWLGSCHPSINCNKKLIGAKNMVDNTPPRDSYHGHGTHVATTAAGNFVPDVSINGLASGVASGVAPYAHLAIYKVCGGPKEKCSDTAVLRAFDEAVMDGVDVISMSLSVPPSIAYENSYISKGSFNAIKDGIHVVGSAGNRGPGASSVQNTEPWILTVAASTVDRYFPATVYLQDPAANSHDSAVGESLADRRKLWTLPPATYKPLLYRTDGDRAHCFYPFDELVASVPDHVLVCDIDPDDPGTVHHLATKILFLKPAAIVLVEPKEVGHTISVHNAGEWSPIVQVSHEQGEIVKKFAVGGYGLINYGVGTQQSSPAPVVASFSGRGPSQQSPVILKPDLLAPGLNILAGVPRGQPAGEFAFMSGTSMATPHVSGLVALLKNAHTTWSPAIVRSALMTTASTRDNLGELILDEQQDPKVPANSYATGAGHVDLARAMDPGLAYDIDKEHYVGYMCTAWGEKAMWALTRNSYDLCFKNPVVPDEDLNYPSIVIRMLQQERFVHRTLTNVHAYDLPETYKVAVAMAADSLVLVDVQPPELTFTSMWETKTFVVRAAPRPMYTLMKGAVFEGSMTWTSSSHTVRSPVIAVVVG